MRSKLWSGWGAGLLGTRYNAHRVVVFTGELHRSGGFRKRGFPHTHTQMLQAYTKLNEAGTEAPQGRCLS